MTLPYLREVIGYVLLLAVMFVGVFVVGTAIVRSEPSFGRVDIAVAGIAMTAAGAAGIWAAWRAETARADAARTKRLLCTWQDYWHASRAHHREHTAAGDPTCPRGCDTAPSLPPVLPMIVCPGRPVEFVISTGHDGGESPTSSQSPGNHE